MAQPSQAVRAGGFGATLREDNWWLEPLATGIGFGLFVIYATWAGLQTGFFEWCPNSSGVCPYISPFYSPAWWRWIGLDEAHPPAWWPLSFGIWVMWVPLVFRLTCYYYRKFYYRAYLMDPPNCAVGEPRGESYSGELYFPWVLQNLHRYTLYLVAIVMVFLWIDAFRALFFPLENQPGMYTFGIGVGTVVMWINVILLSAYTLGCHALRHLVGGGLNCFTCSAAARSCHKMWKGVTALNEHHMFWAWVSMIWVGLTDLYVRLVAMGLVTDVRLF